MVGRATHPRLASGPPRSTGPSVRLGRLLHGGLLVVAAALLTSAPPVSAQQDVEPGDEARTFRPMTPPSGYRAALERGTRGPDGTPGPAYWQQEVRYEIEAELDSAGRRIHGQATVVYRNRSPDTLRRVGLNLYQNIFAPGVRRNRRVRTTGGLELEEVEAGGTSLDRVGRRVLRRRLGRAAAGEAPAPGYYVRGTVGGILLPTALAPGDSTTLGFSWSFRMPGPDEFRMGTLDPGVWNVAQWYPQVATYDDIDGLYLEPYLGDGEFYLEHADFEVELTAPEGWLVVGTGTLRNPEEVLRPRAVRRLEEAPSSDTTVAVVSAADRRAGRATAESGDGTLTWCFRADGVRDFAFAAGRPYVWDAVGADVGGDVGRARVDALYDPDVEHWGEAARYQKHALEFFSDYLGPYPWRHAAAAYGPVGGMEYPMLVFIGRSRPGRPLYSVLAHEHSHQWFPMQVGSREAEFAWMDEGLTSFNEDLATADFFEGIAASETRAETLRRYLAAVQAGREGAPPMRHTDYVRTGRVLAAYTKPAAVLHTLRTVIGPSDFDRAYRRYLEAWRGKHPLPWDFFRVFEREAGRELGWFWRQWLYRTDRLDQALTSVERTGAGVEVTVENRGEAVMPVLLTVETDSGETVHARWPARVWAGAERVTRTVEVEGEPVSVTLDPDRRFPDVDRSGHRWTP